MYVITLKCIFILYVKSIVGIVCYLANISHGHIRSHRQINVLYTPNHIHGWRSVGCYGHFVCFRGQKDVVIYKYSHDVLNTYIPWQDLRTTEGNAARLNM